MELSSPCQIRPGTAVRGPWLSGECSNGLIAPAPCPCMPRQTQNITCPCLCRRWQGPWCHEGPAAAEALNMVEKEDEMARLFSVIESSRSTDGTPATPDPVEVVAAPPAQPYSHRAMLVPIPGSMMRECAECFARPPRALR